MRMRPPELRFPSTVLKNHWEGTRATRRETPIRSIPGASRFAVHGVRYANRSVVNARRRQKKATLPRSFIENALVSVSPGHVMGVFRLRRICDEISSIDWLVVLSTGTRRRLNMFSASRISLWQRASDAYALPGRRSSRTR